MGRANERGTEGEKDRRLCNTIGMTDTVMDCIHYADVVGAAFDGIVDDKSNTNKVPGQLYIWQHVA